MEHLIDLLCTLRMSVLLIWQDWPQAFGPALKKFPRHGLKTNALCRRLHLLNVKREWPVGAKQLRDRVLGRKIEI